MPQQACSSASRAAFRLIIPALAWQRPFRFYSSGVWIGEIECAFCYISKHVAVPGPIWRAENAFLRIFSRKALGSNYYIHEKISPWPRKTSYFGKIHDQPKAAFVSFGITALPGWAAV